jgi:formylglycine-generating enzyme required for sulfatase activity
VLGAFAGGFDAVPALDGDRCVLRAEDLVRPPVPLDAGAGADADAGAPDASVAPDGDASTRADAAAASLSDAGAIPGRADAAIEEPIAFEGNLAVRYAPNSPGFCTSEHCLVPLVADAALGWSVSGARIVLPRAVCDNPSPRVVVQPRGPRQGSAVHPCGEWHASASATRSTELAPPLQTSGRPCRDVRALCIEHRTTCGSLWVQDSSCGAVRRVDCGACRGNTSGMVLLPGGTFLFGAPDSDPDGGDDEKPQSRVAMASFWIDRTEVTTSEYAACIAAGICTRGNTGGFCNMQANDRPLPGRERHPINCVDWYQASAFCAWRGARLPTEQEWEFAARGGAGGTRTFPWGEELPRPDRVCMSDQESGDRESTCEVGAHPLGRSAHGLEDMSGNVWEWTASVYDERGHGYVANPEERTEKGGCWTNFWTAAKPSQRAHLRAAFRSYDARGYQSRTVGFRCARDL